jgi:hypothetical protein
MKRVAAVCAVCAAGLAAAAPVPGQGTWETTLAARDLNSDGFADAYYDKTLNISWLADANVIGAVDFQAAQTWAAGLDVYGVSGWHLPTIHIDSCGTDGYGATFWNGGGICGYGVQPDTSDMAHMNVVTLGNASYSGYVDTYGNGTGVLDNLLENTGPFSNIKPYGYWFSRDYSVDPWSGQASSDSAWRYSFHAGRQDDLSKTSALYAWAVHDGDVGQLAAPVPEPSSYALMALGLTAMIAAVRRRRAAESKK